MASKASCAEIQQTMNHEQTDLCKEAVEFHNPSPAPSTEHLPTTIEAPYINYGIYSLPPEVLRKILMYLVPSGEILLILARRSSMTCTQKLILGDDESPRLAWAVALSTVSERISNNCLDILYGENKIRISSSTIARFVDTIQPHNAQRIKFLEIDHIERLRGSSHQDLLINLRSLTCIPDLTLLCVHSIGEEVVQWGTDTTQVLGLEVWKKKNHLVLQSAIRHHPTLSKGKIIYNPHQRVLRIHRSDYHREMQLDEFEIIPSP